MPSAFACVVKFISSVDSLHYSEIILVLRLAEVGILETPKLQGKYDTGQVGKMLLHLIIPQRCERKLAKY